MSDNQLIPAHAERADEVAEICGFAAPLSATFSVQALEDDFDREVQRPRGFANLVPR
jgi:hypothetical protein